MSKIENIITIYVELERTNKTLYYRYYPIFHGYISELLGNETYGSQKNNYTYTNLCGGRCEKDGFSFPNNPYFFIRTSHESVWNNFLKNIEKKKNIFDGFTVKGFCVIETPINQKYYNTDASTPILVSNKYNHVNHLSGDELSDCENYLVENIKRRAKEDGFDIDESLKIEIVQQRRKRDILYGDIINKGRNLKVKINCNDDTKKFILLHGLGRSTGCGFGFLI